MADNNSKNISAPSPSGEGGSVGYYDFCRGNGDIYHLLKEHARRMRKNPTEAESVLWQHLKCSQIGVSFKRQCVILDFIADFYSPEINLIVEVDGKYHDTDKQVVLDMERTERLKSKGYKIIRFTNDQVLYETEKVIAALQKIIDKEYYG